MSSWPFPSGNDDDTVKIIARPPPTRPTGGRKPISPLMIAIVAAAVLAGAGATAALLLEKGGSPPDRSATVKAAPPAPAAALPFAGEDDLLADTTPPGPFRFAQAPGVIVMGFVSLHAQALAMNRIGAFVEKASMPRDRVLDDASLAAAITAAHESFDTLYFGHDYRAADLARFFATASRQGVALRPEELTLQAMLLGAGTLKPGAVGALITLPPVSDTPARVSRRARATILRHELSHALYFTDPAYAAATAHFWEVTLTAAERDKCRKFLADDGYDSTNEDLMRNETQAYLVHTADNDFFRPSQWGLTDEEAARLRAAFIRDMPPSWLRDRTR